MGWLKLARYLPKDADMKVVLRTGDRMELRGVPQGRSLPFGILVCTGIGVVAGIFTYIQWANSKSIWAAVPPALGVALMLFIVVILALMAFQRERVVLDKVTKTVEQETWSMLWGSRKMRSYPFERLSGVAIQRTLEASGGRKGFPIRVTKARLLISRPRRAIDLDEVQSSDEAPLEAIANEVAEFLGVEIRLLGSHDDPGKKQKSAPPVSRRRARSRD